MRRLVLLSLALLLITTLASPTLAGSDESLQAKNSAELLLYTNKERVSAGITPLLTFDALQAAATTRAVECTSSFSHTRPDGTSCFSVLDEYSVSYNYAAENIAAGQPSAKSALEGWMDSSGHRENIMSPRLTHVGGGYAYAAQDDYHNYWTQVFVGVNSPSYTNLRVVSAGSEAPSFPQGTTLEQIESSLAYEVRANIMPYGECSMPLLASFCSGYDPNAQGVQTVSVNCFGISASFTISFDGSVAQPILGDVTGDSIVNTGDAVMLLRVAANLTELNQAQALLADYNKDGAVNTGDAVAILRFVAGF